MKYGKLENGRLCPAPKLIEKDGNVHYQPSEALLRENGYLPIIETPCPPSEEGETAVYTCHYEQQNDAILVVWHEETATQGGETEGA